MHVEMSANSRYRADTPKLFCFKKAVCALITASRGLFPETSFFAVETDVRLGRIISTAKKEFSGNEPCEAVRHKWSEETTEVVSFVEEEDPGCVGWDVTPYFSPIRP